MSSTSAPFSNSDAGSIFQRYQWPVSWITLPGAGEPPYVLGFRLKVNAATETTLRCCITADERYELFLDGERVGSGPERGSAEAWYYDTLELPVQAGSHVLFARVWALGEHAPVAQSSVRPGFLFAVETADGADAAWSTGLANWEVKRIGGYAWVDCAEVSPFRFTGDKLHIDGRLYPWGVEKGEGDGWVRAEINSKAFTSHPTDLYPVRLLVQGTLPPMLRRPVPAGKVRFVEEFPTNEPLKKRRIDGTRHLPEIAAQIEALLSGSGALRISVNRNYRALIDLGNYFCAYPQLVMSRGRDAQVTLAWAEALYEEIAPGAWSGRKANRHEIEGRLFVGFSDSFVGNGEPERSYTTLWWQAGRYVELVIETRGEELVLEKLTLVETRYPLERESTFSASDARLEAVAPILLRSLQMNAHETFMDCPYYEQLNYVGDTLIDCLVIFATTHDIRLARKSLQLFHDSRIPEGLTQSRFPSRIRQIIPPFSLLWVSMLRNHAWWRGEADFIRTLLPGARGVIDVHLRHVNSEGLLESLRGWNFLDWVDGWEGGGPPGSDQGAASGTLNWLFVYILQAAVELETLVGEPELAARYTRLADAQARATEAAFWDEGRGMFADDREHRHFSEHGQCLAILSGRADVRQAARAAEGLTSATDLKRCTIYFSHYLLETFRKIGQTEPLFRRLQSWFDLPGQGFVTTPEQPEPTRSDCHAWGSHPLFHYHATILGIRPAAMGFAEVEIRPLLGPLQNARGRLAHPRGWIEVDVHRAGDRLEGTVSLPEGVTGIFQGSAGSQVLMAGAQKVSG